MADWGPIRVGKVRVRQLRMKMNAKCAIPPNFVPAGKVDDLCADQGKGCVGPSRLRRRDADGAVESR